MKQKRRLEAKTPTGAAPSAKYRARSNNLTDRECEQFDDEFIKLYYDGDKGRRFVNRQSK